jgi:pullulanase/glycogen debranching enzyme
MEQIADQFKELMYKPMSRRDFLKYLGITFLTLIGVFNILKTLFNYENNSNSYGYSNYQGKKGVI